MAGSVERKKGTLLFKGKTESLVQRNTTQQEKGPSVFPAGDRRLTRGEGDADGEVIKKITRGDNKGGKNVCSREQNPVEPTLSQLRKASGVLEVRGHTESHSESTSAHVTRGLNSGTSHKTTTWHRREVCM